MLYGQWWGHRWDGNLAAFCPPRPPNLTLANPARGVVLPYDEAALDVVMETNPFASLDKSIRLCVGGGERETERERVGDRDRERAKAREKESESERERERKSTCVRVCERERGRVCERVRKRNGTGGEDRLPLSTVSSTLQCVLQSAAVCCSVLQCVAVYCSVWQCVAVCCSVLQCVADFRQTYWTGRHSQKSACC